MSTLYISIIYLNLFYKYFFLKKVRQSDTLTFILYPLLCISNPSALYQWIYVIIKKTGAKVKKKGIDTMNEKYLDSAMLFARLYGIAETLNPWEYMENEKFISMIWEWADEFVSMGNGDVLRFFESKIEQKKTEHHECIE